jgi:hypothetical protein
MPPQAMSLSCCIRRLDEVAPFLRDVLSTLCCLIHADRRPRCNGRRRRPRHGVAAVGTDSGSTALQQITVLGQRTTPEIARSAQQQALNLINLTTADEMQRLPDVKPAKPLGACPAFPSKRTPVRVAISTFVGWMPI